MPRPGMIFAVFARARCLNTALFFNHYFGSKVERNA